MGLLDWLSDAIGSDNSGSAPPLSPDMGAGAGLTALNNRMAGRPPVPPAAPDLSTSDIGAGMTPAGPPGAPPPTPGSAPVPIPQPRPAAANAPVPIPASTPPLPPQVPTGTAPPPMDTTIPGPQAHTMLGRAIGLDPNAERTFLGSLGKGLTAAGNTKPGAPALAALASGAGASLEGHNESSDKIQEQQNKFLTQQINASKAGDEHQLNIAKTKQALADAENKMAGGKDSVMNSQQQLYLRAMGLVNNDPEVKLAKSTYEAALKETGDPNSAAAKAASKAHSDLVQAKIKAHLGALGLDPGLAEKLGKMPGSTQDNPVPKEGLSQQKFDQLPPGAYFVNPKDGRVLIKKAPAAPGAGGAPPAGPPSAPAAPPSGGTPPMPPMPPTNPTTATAGIGAGSEEDEEE